MQQNALLMPAQLASWARATPAQRAASALATAPAETRKGRGGAYPLFCGLLLGFAGGVLALAILLQTLTQEAAPTRCRASHQPLPLVLDGYLFRSVQLCVEDGVAELYAVGVTADAPGDLLDTVIMTLQHLHGVINPKVVSQAAAAGVSAEKLARLAALVTRGRSANVQPGRGVQASAAGQAGPFSEADREDVGAAAAHAAGPLAALAAAMCDIANLALQSLTARAPPTDPLDQALDACSNALPQEGQHVSSVAGRTGLIRLREAVVSNPDLIITALDDNMRRSNSRGSLTVDQLAPPDPLL